MSRPGAVLRLLASIGLIAATALAHGGVFRPPPRKGPRDPTRGPLRPGATVTAARASATLAVRDWEAWWYQNREPYLRLRDRVLERTIITGTKRRTELFDREKLRANLLLPLMLEQARHDSEEIRTSAAVALGKFRAPNMAPLLLDLLKRDRIRQVRESAMLGLMLLRDPTLRDTFRKAALDLGEKRRIRNFAVLALGFIGDTGFLTKIATRRGVALRGSASEVEELRSSATLALGFTGSRGAVHTLARLALDRDAPRGVRGYAGTSLARLADPLALPEMIELLRATDDERHARFGAAIAVGALVRPDDRHHIDFLAKKAQRDKDPGVRALLTMSLGRIGGERAATHIAATLAGADQQLRGFCHVALGMTRSGDAGPILVAEFERAKSARLRAACAIGLALAGHRKAAPMLREEVGKKHPAFVTHGMVALGILDDAKAIGIVQEILEDKRDPAIRAEAATALVLLRRGAAIGELVEVLKDSKSIFTRGGIAIALGRVGDDKAVPPLMDLFRDERRDAEERAIALAALGRIGDDDRIPLLARLAFGLNPCVDSDAVAEALTII